MKTIIVDANIILTVALNLPQKSLVIANTVDCRLIAPTVLPFEIGNALSAMVKRKQLDKQQAIAVLAQTQTIDVTLMPFSLMDAVNLAFDHTIYAYDAYYLQLAIETGVPIFTFDKAMKDVANLLGINLIKEVKNV